MSGAHRKKSPGRKQQHKPAGRHRKPAALPLTWRTTGGVIVGAAVLGTAAATAQASVLPFGSVPTQVTAADLNGAKGGGAGGTSASKDRAEAASAKGKDRPEDGGREDGKGENDERSGKERPESGATEQPSGKERPTAEEAIELARSQVGIKEDGNGETKYNKWYMEHPRAKETLARDGGSLQGYDDAAWCDMFISWIGDQLGFTDQFGSDAWTVAHAKWFRDQGRWGTEPRPGAIVFYAWSGSKSIDDIVHIGMVTKKIDDGTIEAVEGNTDKAVRVRERPARSIVGYGYPEYRS
ncbi:CHAP domain-containing protein [Actinomadura sp. GC306]|uniref:CHAP domain-containing protein n=1 Tax=Actinomadura sp. GC306 TaxID=2530367 RepID=UPI00104FA399|nr:CHAP domain-containing protein [Actinomadura sp. GC306]TDC62239.1 CHAP domain-containing protein [Actinomadura sp. GC306]